MIGERLQELRKDAGLTQDELAEILNINKHSISSYERDKSEPPDAIKILIAGYFHVTVDYLLGVTDNPGAASNQIVLRIPSSFPSDQLSELESYMNYLIYKSKNSCRTAADQT